MQTGPKDWQKEKAEAVKLLEGYKSGKDKEGVKIPYENLEDYLENLELRKVEEQNRSLALYLEGRVQALRKALGIEKEE